MGRGAEGLPGPAAVAEEYAALAGSPGCCAAFDPRAVAEIAGRPEAVDAAVRAALAPMLPDGHTMGSALRRTPPLGLSRHLAGRASHYGVAESVRMEVRPTVLRALLGLVRLAPVVPRGARRRAAVSVPSHVAEEWLAGMEPVALRLGWRLLRDRFPRTVALQRLVLRHEGMHAAIWLRSGGASALSPVQEECVCDVHGAAMAAAETGLSVASALADFRAVSCLLHAAAGHGAWFGHWTVGALDRAAPEIEGALADGTAADWTPASVSDLFDRAAAAAAPVEPEALSRLATGLAGEARGVADLLARLSDHPALRPYGLRMAEALGRSAEPA